MGSPDLEQRISQLEQELQATKQALHKVEEERNRLAWDLSRRLFNEKDWENFDPSEYTVSLDEILTAIDSVKE